MENEFLFYPAIAIWTLEFGFHNSESFDCAQDELKLLDCRCCLDCDIDYN